MGDELNSRRQKKSEVTPREKALVQGVAAGLPVTEAGRRAGYSEESALAHVYRVLDRPRVRSFLTQALEASGLKAADIVQPYLDGLTATYVIKNVTNGRITVTDAPDHRSRMDAADRIARL